jgi:hypothetical protein
MTSPAYNERKRLARLEMEIFDALPSRIRAAINSARGSVRASSARDALLRGVSEQAIIDLIQNSQYVVTKKPKGNQS